MNSLTQEQIRRNADSRLAWDRYESHRRQVCAQLTHGRKMPNGRLCVLGAGNCNDLDLRAFGEAFEEVVLVDLDPEAVAWGVANQGVEGRAVRVVAPVDVTGVHALLAGWRQSPPDDVAIADCVERLRVGNRELPATLSGPFDAVASVCLLTQLIDSLVKSLDERHPRFVELVLAMRQQHLRSLLELTKPGGAATLITDVVSSVTCPDLPTTPDAELPGLLTRLVEARNFFSGVNPFALLNVLRNQPELNRLADAPQLWAPWKWDFGPRVYVVVAVEMRRK